MSNKHIALRLSMLYIILYGAYGCFNPFVTLYLQQRGMSYTQIGIAYGVMGITAVITQPIWGFITDKYRSKKAVLITLPLISAMLVFNFVFANNFTYIILSILFIAAIHSSIAPIADAYTYEIIDVHSEIHYTRIRLMGSFGFAVAALVAGIMIKWYGINSSYYAYSLAMVLTAIIVLGISFKSKSKHTNINLIDGLHMLKSRAFSLFLLSILFANISLGANNGYITVLIQETGGDVSKLGLLWFIVAISELPVFFMGNAILKKYGEMKIYALGVLFLALRFYLDSICTSYIQVILVQLLQTVSFTFYLMAAIQHVNNITAVKIRTSALTVFFSISGAGALIGNIGGGILLEHISVFSLYKIVSVVGIISVLILLALKENKRGNTL